MIKKVLVTIAVVLIFGLFYSFIKQIQDSLLISSRVDQEAEEVVKLQQENNQLKKQLVESEGPATIERIARDKLDFARAGETVMIIPPEQIDRLLAAQNPLPAEKRPNWEGWLKLFWK